MKKTLLLILISLFSFETSGQNNSLLSENSSDWNMPYNSDTLEIFHTYFLNDEETQLSQLINMARKNPRLFADYILLPYAKKYGYTDTIQKLMQKLTNATPLPKMFPERSLTNMLRNKMNTIIDSANQNFSIKDSIFTNLIFIQVKMIIS